MYQSRICRIQSVNHERDCHRLRQQLQWKFPELWQLPRLLPFAWLLLLQPGLQVLDQLIIKLVKNKNQKEHDYNGTDQANAGIDLFFQV